MAKNKKPNGKKEKPISAEEQARILHVSGQILERNKKAYTELASK